MASVVMNAIDSQVRHVNTGSDAPWINNWQPSFLDDHHRQLPRKVLTLDHYGRANPFGFLGAGQRQNIETRGTDNSQLEEDC